MKKSFSIDYLYKNRELKETNNIIKDYQAELNRNYS